MSSNKNKRINEAALGLHKSLQDINLNEKVNIGEAQRERSMKYPPVLLQKRPNLKVKNRRPTVLN